MKQSTTLKAICYVLIPIFIGIIVLSACSIIVQNDSNFEEREYYASSNFVGTYMNDISNACEDLIYNNGKYYNLEDGNITIYFTDLEKYYSNIQDFEYLIIYKNKALTNVVLEENTKTIEGIKEYINNNNKSKKVNIIKGEIFSDNERIQKNGVQYLDGLTNKYYTITDNYNEENTNGVEYITTKYGDFEIYTSYMEGFRPTSEEAIILNILNSSPIITDNSYIMIPICLAFLILMIIYLIISIGNDKKLNGFDKIPFEIIAFFSILISGISIALPLMIGSSNYDLNAVLSFIFTGCLVVYIMTALCITTFIKRIKARAFWRTTLVGKIYFWLKGKLQNIAETLTYSKDITYKVLGYGIGIAIIACLILLIFRVSGFTIISELLLFDIVLYKTIKFFKQYSKIEQRLKEMKEGNNQVELNTNEFMPELRNTAKYINNVSEGIENAIQDRIKSERLKAELITNVSHDIKTPLTSIINYVDLLKNEKIENEKANEYIGILDSKAKRLKKLTEDLIDASKVSTGNISLNMEKINIVELVRQAAGEFEDRFKKSSLETIINSLENEIYIMADSRYMYRIIENLFSNIAKYALENSRVYVDLKREDKVVKIDIKNISKEKLNISSEELMQRFVRGDRSRTTEGSGLGISIAQNLTELQHGKFNLILDGDLFKVEIEFKEYAK